MPITKESLSDIKEQYEKADKLVEKDSKHDPEAEPFRSHYAAREILITLQNNLKNTLKDFEPAASVGDEVADCRTYKYILGYIYKDTGRICVWTEELALGEEYLMKCVALLEPYKLHAECVTAYMGALNQIGILWSNRQNPKESQKFLLEAEDLYKKFKETGLVPMTIWDIFGAREEIENGKGLDILEKTHTLTLYYLAQILGTLGDLHQSAVYCHTTLKRQLELDDYEAIDWALNAATLSQYFFNQQRYTESRHHLAAAQYMLDQHELVMYTDDMNDEERAAVKETFHHRSADVMRCWAKYGLNLLVESKNRLLDENSPETPKRAKPEKLCKFDIRNLGSYEGVITDQHLLMYDDAKPVFLTTQTWLNRAKDYYNSETEASEYAKIMQDLALCYKYLAFFEFDEHNQCKMHKRRADILEELLQLLNETYYLSTCRELWYELGLAYSAILDIKLDLQSRARAANKTPNPHALNKINVLCHKSIAKFQTFIASYSDKTTHELKKGLTEEEMEPILFAYFECGRLYYKLSTPDRTMQIVNTQNSLRYYQLLVNACEGEQKFQARMKAEYGVCKEMTTLLPLKIQKLQDGTLNQLQQ